MIEWEKALVSAKYVQITESIDIHADTDTELMSKVAKMDLTYIDTIYGRTLASVFYPKLGDYTQYGFIAESGNLLIVALRCTMTTLEAFHDISFLSVPNPIGNSRGWVEAGFSAIYGSLTAGKEITLADRLHKLSLSGKYSRIRICGHSLGGALATLAAYDIANRCHKVTVSCYTYGSPRVGGKVFALYYNALVPLTFRIVVKGDPVQYVPILPAYYHVDQRYELDAGKKVLDKLDLLCYHHISTYIYLLDRRLGVGLAALGKGCEYCSLWTKIKRLFKRKR